MRTSRRGRLASTLTPAGSMKLDFAKTHPQLEVRLGEVGQGLGGADEVVAAERDRGGAAEHVLDGLAAGAVGGDAAQRVLDHLEARAALAQLAAELLELGHREAAVCLL